MKNKIKLLQNRAKTDNLYYLRLNPHFLVPFKMTKILPIRLTQLTVFTKLIFQNVIIVISDKKGHC